MCPLSPFSALTPKTESQTKQKQSPFFISIGTPGTTTLPFPSVYPPFQPLPRPGICRPAAGPPRWGPSIAAPSPMCSPPRPLHGRERMWPCPRWPDQEGQGSGGHQRPCRAGRGGCLRGSPVTRGPERGGRRRRRRRRRALRSPQYTHP